MVCTAYTPYSLRLNAFYGTRTWRPGRTGLEELILTILSQSTTDRNSGRAYLSLRSTFPVWSDVATAPHAAVVQAIRVAGLATDKATRIQTVLRDETVIAHGYTLDFLDNRSLADALAWLTAFPGIGNKTAGCVLLFAYGKAILPVDTHIARVAFRCGLTQQRAAEHAHTVLNMVVPPEEMYAAHMHLIQLGRLVCHAAKPACGECPLSDICMRQGVPT